MINQYKKVITPQPSPPKKEEEQFAMLSHYNHHLKYFIVLEVFQCLQMVATCSLGQPGQKHRLPTNVQLPPGGLEYQEACD